MFRIRQQSLGPGSLPPLPGIGYLHINAETVMCAIAPSFAPLLMTDSLN